MRERTMNKWLKGNTHIHSTVSDGGLDFHQLAERYAAAGYDFLFRTDHWLSSRAHEDEQSYPLLWLDGNELDGFSQSGIYYHIVCLGTLEGILRGMSLEDALRKVKDAQGMVILAHPHWTGNTLDDVLGMPFDGMEVYNHVCQWMNGKGWSDFLWHQALEHRSGIMGLASDDAHINPSDPGWNGGWVMAHAEEKSQEGILEALKKGEFYASTGPTIEEITVTEDEVALRCSPAKFIRLVGPRYHCRKLIAPEGEWLTEARFQVPLDWEYAVLQVEDDQRRLAWSNNLAG